MSKSYITFQALPDDCNAFMGRMVPEGEEDDMTQAYCEECERRHGFVPVDD